MAELHEVPPPPCPWCPYTAGLTHVVRHMETVHHERWLALALDPLLTERPV